MLPASDGGRRILSHTAFWIGYFVFYAVVVLYGVYKIHDPLFFLQFMVFFPFEIALVYLNIYVLIPKFLYEKKYWQYGGLLLLFICISIVINQFIKNYYAENGSVYYAATAGWTTSNLVSTGLERIYLLGLTTGIKLARDWIQNIQLMREKEKIYLETELNFLRSQIQPHFFFNTLNNLYSLTLKKSDHAPDVVLKLSELMSYMLYESNTQLVQLDKEINFLQNFMDLEQLRFGDRMKVRFDIDGITENKKIPPLILILFVENSFKHGAKNNLREIGIEINLTVSEKQLIFTISNPVEVTQTDLTNNGIGLKNVKRRLDLLYGPDYSLLSETSDEQYITRLMIPL
ncbi:MAG: histidine kinase [Chitinophagaceae bacterium]|nr:MAG: histidine kinase [Chitinophagaceae bacterium]